MRTMVLLLAAALAIGFGMPGQAGHGSQSGTNSDCLDFNVLYQVAGVYSPLAEFVDAHAGQYTVNSPDGIAFVDFFDGAGNWLGWSAGAGSGSAPAGTAIGTICVGATGGYPDVPIPGASWSFTQ